MVSKPTMFPTKWAGQVWQSLPEGFQGTTRSVHGGSFFCRLFVSRRFEWAAMVVARILPSHPTQCLCLEVCRRVEVETCRFAAMIAQLSAFDFGILVLYSYTRTEYTSVILCVHKIK